MHTSESSTNTALSQPDLPPELVATQHLYQLAMGYIASSALQVAARLGVADELVP